MMATLMLALTIILPWRNPHAGDEPFVPRATCIQECVLFPDGRTVCTDVECPPERPGRVK